MTTDVTITKNRTDGEWENGRMGEWKNGRMGEWENGRMGEWENPTLQRNGVSKAPGKIF
jgi:hypothetical protein